MGAGQPFIYERPVAYSSINPYNSFDPKAYTRATYAPAPQPRPKPQGPLIEFNKHPDSWLVTPYGKTSYEPMSPHTKTRVKRARGIQQCSRLLSFLSALGVLVCVIYIRNTQGTEGWIIRVPAAVDLLTTCYAIYHLGGSAKARAPASSTSYHFFASFMDAGLIPFYIYTALVAKNNFEKKVGDEDRWTSTAGSPDGTNKIIATASIASVVSAGLHIFSFFVSLYLLTMFRKISNLPPDMNPLEDNLTSRSKTKHKYKNSGVVSEKDLKHLSASTGSAVSISTSDRSSAMKEQATANSRPISFLHTRDSSDRIYSPHNPRTANASRTDLANSQLLYQQSPLSQASHMDLPSTNDETLTQRSDSPSKRSHGIFSEVSSHLPTLASARFTDPHSETHTPPLPRKSSKRDSIPSSSENWRVVDTNDDGVSFVDEDEEFERDARKNVVSALSIKKVRNRAYEPLQHSRHSPEPDTYLRVQNSPSYKPVVKQSPRLEAESENPVFVLQPLGMNPPTPPPNSLRTTRRVLTPTSGNANANNGHPLSRSETPTSVKSKYYGDLKDAYQGIRNSGSPSPSPANSPGKKQGGVKQESGLAVSEWIASSGSGVSKKDFAHTGEKHGQSYDNNGRVVSRSGADITDAPYIEDYGSDMLPVPGGGYGGMGNRSVSGKMAEEGIAGVGSKGWKGSWPRRRISGRLGWRTGR